MGVAVGVVVVAAGLGTRLGAGMPKALVTVCGEPLVRHAVRRALAARDVADLVVVFPPMHREDFEAALAGIDGVRLVEGGAERTDSVAAGLRTLSPDAQVVLVHDAARAFAPAALFDTVAAAVTAGADAAVPGIPLVDTVKQVDASGVVVATPNRASLRAVQTPQGFTREALERAHAGGRHATDDAALVEADGGRVVVVDGNPAALKVTTPADLDIIQRLCSRSGE
ncbi:2-C-methyl-D-erythritol 4-phosphate cytidylyltransferase [Calidifontibacter sp. DB0510]|uniref:2-C-methyl-D-erythritol 4-phosphate cytidylyltransferase n=1 Tax=Metallococcus carri TaxID=1656884 RepID=A0A967B016_9MICO|nr:2-C-methyl-D-erythritol 4-phosphate cytidylyltransferase [Metallococcus carri]NHN55524.1 2-C-methyl-D-erythritol 4-phosphate cytidylyltransferase [Metallococcus carri]NOP38292.1 2-C-methyl-D-erythritol 4-phosphate cytidylyltransferase [Calidifontibacter sp. DB2511S]